MLVAGQRSNNGVVFSLGSVLRTRCWAKVVFSFRSVPRLTPKLTALMALLGSSDATVVVR
jgi:hypothetical protein